MISYKEALTRLSRSKLSIKSERILSINSLNRICSENVYSRFNYPAADNTALDGFALNTSEINKSSKSKTIKLKVWPEGISKEVGKSKQIFLDDGLIKLSIDSKKGKNILEKLKSVKA